MQRISRDLAKKYAFDWRDEPLLHVELGETFEIETYDASTGFFQTPEDKAIPAKRPGFDRSPPLANPIAGPVRIAGVVNSNKCYQMFVRTGAVRVCAAVASKASACGRRAGNTLRVKDGVGR